MSWNNASEPSPIFVVGRKLIGIEKRGYPLDLTTVELGTNGPLNEKRLGFSQDAVKLHQYGRRQPLSLSPILGFE
jgi:hypothetical protein